MKVLLVHNLYGSGAPSGENQVFRSERDLLRRRGHEVLEFTRESDEIRAKGWLGTLQGALSTPWNPFSVRRIGSIVAEFRPDVMHVHNTFPLLSPGIFRGVRGRVARVLTLHNYRIFCAAATVARGRDVCTLCLDRRSSLPAVRFGCYRNSRLATIPLATSIALHRALGTWKADVDAYIALTEFQKERLVDAGLPSKRVFVKPNFYPGDPRVTPWASREECAVYAGRLAPEKGIDTLVRAWQLWGDDAPALKVVGDGPLRSQIEKLSGTPHPRVRVFGPMSPADTQRTIATAKLLIVPSLWFEGFPMVLQEALAFGTPVAVSNIGALPAIADNGQAGTVFRAGDEDDMLRAIRKLWESPGLLESCAHRARDLFVRHYNEDVNYRAMMTIYRQALKHGA